jgi:hypothetical protein
MTSEAGGSGAYGTFSFAYDLDDRLTRITWPDGFYANYVLDGIGEVEQIRENDLGERTGFNRGNGVNTSYGYDGAWRLSSLVHSFPNTGNNQSLGFAYNAADQVLTRTSTNAAYDYAGFYTVNRSYGRNGQNQVTTAGTASYNYDGPGPLRRLRLSRQECKSPLCRPGDDGFRGHLAPPKDRPCAILGRLRA